MPTKKCPRCGSNKYQKVLYGRYILSEEDMDKYHLGGCMITPFNGKWYCKKCKHTFEDKLFVEGSVFFFMFQVNNYDGENILYYMDGMRQSFHRVKSNGQRIDMEHIEENKNDYYITAQSFEKREWKILMRKLDRLCFTALKNRYVNKDIMDGTTWEMKLDSFISKKSYGVNKYPVYWDKIINTLNSIFEG